MLEHERWLEIAKRDLNDAHRHYPTYNPQPICIVIKRMATEKLITCGNIVEPGPILIS
jgi:hypothetical protein